MLSVMHGVKCQVRLHIALGMTIDNIPSGKRIILAKPTSLHENRCMYYNCNYKLGAGL